MVGATAGAKPAKLSDKEQKALAAQILAAGQVNRVIRYQNAITITCYHNAAVGYGSCRTYVS